MTDEPMTVAEVEALLEGTTPGPWLADRVWWKHHERIADRWEWCIDVSEGTIASLPEDDEATAAADAALIAAAPRIAAALIAALGERDAMRAMLHEAIRLLAVPIADMDTAYGAACDAFLSLCPESGAALASHPVAPQPEDG